MKQNERRVRYQLGRCKWDGQDRECGQEGLVVVWDAYEKHQPDEGLLATYFTYTIRHRFLNPLGKREQREQEDELLV